MDANPRNDGATTPHAETRDEALEEKYQAKQEH